MALPPRIAFTADGKGPAVSLLHGEGGRRCAFAHYANGRQSDVLILSNVVIGPLSSESFDNSQVDNQTTSLFDSETSMTLMLKMPVSMRNTLLREVLADTKPKSRKLRNQIEIDDFSWVPTRASKTLSYTVADEKGGIQRLPNFQDFLVKVRSSLRADVGIKIELLPPYEPWNPKLEISVADIHVRDLHDEPLPVAIYGFQSVATNTQPSPALLKKLEEMGIRQTDKT